MEELKTQTVKIQRDGVTEEYKLTEKDHGDMVVYDISREGNYLVTIAKDGSILFMNFDAPDRDKEIFKLSLLNLFIEKIKSVS